MSDTKSIKSEIILMQAKLDLIEPRFVEPDKEDSFMESHRGSQYSFDDIMEVNGRKT